MYDVLDGQLVEELAEVAWRCFPIAWLPHRGSCAVAIEINLLGKQPGAVIAGCLAVWLWLVVHHGACLSVYSAPLIRHPIAIKHGQLEDNLATRKENVAASGAGCAVANEAGAIRECHSASKDVQCPALLCSA